MARITHVKAARKPQTCERCGRAITPGESYKWCQPRAYRGATGRKRVRCAECPTWKPSELTSSDKLATIYAAQEDFSEGTYDDPEAMASALEEAAESIREAAEGYRESAQSIEDGFQHPTAMSEELTEKADAVEGWADEIDTAAGEIRDLEEDAKCDECGETEEEGPHHEYDEGGEGCTVEDCEADEAQHHDYSFDWLEAAEALAEVLQESPL